MMCSQCGFEDDSSLRFAHENTFPTSISRGWLPSCTVEAGELVLIDERPPHGSPLGAGESR